MGNDTLVKIRYSKNDLIGIINWPYVKLTGKSLFYSPFAKGRGREGSSKKVLFNSPFPISLRSYKTFGIRDPEERERRIGKKTSSIDMKPEFSKCKILSMVAS
jgi:hypothetical protein